MNEVWCETCQDYHVVDLTDDDVVARARRDGCEIRLDDLDEEIIVPVLAGTPQAIIAWLNN